MAITPAALRRIRTKELRLTQKELAEQVGVHPNSICRMENGDMVISEPVSRLVQFLAAAGKKKR